MVCLIDCLLACLIALHGPSFDCLSVPFSVCLIHSLIGCVLFCLIDSLFVRPFMITFIRLCVGLSVCLFVCT